MNCNVNVPPLPENSPLNRPLRHLWGVLALVPMALSGCVIVTDVDADWEWFGDWRERTEEVHAVDRIEFNAPGTLYVTQGPRNAIKLEGHEDVLDNLRVFHRDDALVIGQSSGEMRWFEFKTNGKDPVYTLEINDLKHIRHTGNGTLKVGPMTTSELSIVSGDHAKTLIASLNARRIKIDAKDHAHVRVETLDSDEVLLSSRDHADLYIHDSNVLDADVDTTEHGQIWIAGKTDSLTLSLRDHSDLDAVGLSTAVANVYAANHTTAVLTVTEQTRLESVDHADVDVQGPGDVIIDEGTTAAN